ncbi:MAG: prepilin peptidase [Candidatus Pacebacteria bacterium]|nr:prepilin peptidase [Candidatus Paceibacterota bacterium]
MLPFIFLFFIFGLIIGSFLNVVVSRYNTKRTLAGRSACMSCATQLRWYELVPLFSYFALRGRCRTCSTRISMHYPFVELTTGLIFVGIFCKFQNIFLFNLPVFAVTFAFYAIVFSILIVIASYDIKHKIIPDMLAFLFGLFAFFGLFLFQEGSLALHLPGIWDVLMGIVVALPFAIFWLVSRGAWMGLGDAKLTIGLAWLLGLSQVLSGIVLAFWSGAIIGVLLIFFTKKHGMKSEIPFAPFLVLGAILAFLFEIHIFAMV